MSTLTAEKSKTSTEAGKKSGREWIYVKKPGGPLYNKRQVLGYSLLAFFFMAPFLKIGGEPLLMFNVIERKFVLFGSVFWPQDFHILMFAMLIVLVGIVLFTAIYGRVWCGWTCPQTVFMELVFRRIEYLVEGDWTQQKKLNKLPGNDRTRIIKKSLKHGLFLLVSFLIANIFLAYVIGADALLKIITEPVSQHIGGLAALMAFTLVFYAVFAYVREYVCTTVCPYGRLQSVLMDEQSLTVAYDQKRGEPRGKRKKGQENVIGDCVDCKLCVHVCPTGIDIRNGVQMECVNCTACIDACNSVMDKLDLPKDLIGFYSSREIDGTAKKKNHTRAIAYTGVLLVLMGIFMGMIVGRTQVDGTLLRARGTTFQIRPDGRVANLYSLELINKTNDDLTFELVAVEDNLDIQLVNNITSIKKNGTAQMSIFLVGDAGVMEKYKTNVKINVVSEGKVLETMKTTYISPGNR